MLLGFSHYIYIYIYIYISSLQCFLKSYKYSVIFCISFTGLKENLLFLMRHFLGLDLY